MKLTNVPNLRTEDFPDQQSWISKLFVQLNPFFQTMNQILDQNIDYTTNVKAVTKEFSITTSFQEFSFAWPYKDNLPSSLSVISATKTAQKTPCILVAAWSYDNSKKSITISKLLEISSGSVSTLSGVYNYTIRVTV